MSRKFKFSSVEEGRFIITRFDDYLERISPRERSMKMCTERYVSEDEFISFLEDSVLPWNFKEISFIGSVVVKINELLAPLNIDFHEDIELIKTTGKEEWNCAYTRANAIFIPIEKIETYNCNEMLRLLAHKFCHVFLRRKKEIREKLYGCIGFSLIDEIINDNSILSRKLTNPDAPCINCFIEVQHRDEAIRVAPICMFNEVSINFTEGDVHKNTSLKLAAIEKNNNRWSVRINEGKPLLYDVNDINGFYEQIGRNTDYIIHPEEILAENFILLLEGKTEVPTPKILVEFKKILTDASR